MKRFIESEDRRQATLRADRSEIVLFETSSRRLRRFTTARSCW